MSRADDSGVDVNPNPNNRGLFPYDAIVGILPNVDRVCDVVEELKSNGFTESEIVLLSGEDGVATIDPEGRNHGLLGRIFRKLDTIGDEHDESAAHVKALRAGELVVGVQIDNDQEKQQALRVFGDNDGHRVSYYTKWTSEQLIP